MSNPERPELSPDDELWQLLKAYAGEDWNAATAPWPAPAERYFQDASRQEAATLAAEITGLQRACPDHAAWRALLEAAHVANADALAAAVGGLPNWAEDLRRRAEAAAAL